MGGNGGWVSGGACGREERGRGRLIGVGVVGLGGGGGVGVVGLGGWDGGVVVGVGGWDGGVVGGGCRRRRPVRDLWGGVVRGGCGFGSDGRKNVHV
jgi:hypothetical protein